MKTLEEINELLPNRKVHVRLILSPDGTIERILGIDVFRQDVSKEEQYDIYMELQENENYKEFKNAICGTFFDKDDTEITLYEVNREPKISRCVSLQLCPDTEEWEKAKKVGLI